MGTAKRFFTVQHESSDTWVLVERTQPEARTIARGSRPAVIKYTNSLIRNLNRQRVQFHVSDLKR